jgi:hypothetical protein
MDEGDTPQKQQKNKYWKWVIHSFFSFVITHFNYAFKVSQCCYNFVCASSSACSSWENFVAIGDVFPYPFAFQTPFPSTILSTLFMLGSHIIIKLHTWFHWWCHDTL